MKPQGDGILPRVRPDYLPKEHTTLPPRDAADDTEWREIYRRFAQLIAFFRVDWRQLDSTHDRRSVAWHAMRVASLVSQDAPPD